MFIFFTSFLLTNIAKIDLSSCKMRTKLFYDVNTVVADALAM